MDRLCAHRLPPADKVLLVRACLPVVLRRDLSLTRRLHTWLLGPSDVSQDQMDHLRKFALDPLRSSLVEDMAYLEDAMDAAAHSNQSGTDTGGLARRRVVTRRQRAFKIFISLLDKWEIGAPLTEVAVMDAFAAVQTFSEHLAPADIEEVSGDTDRTFPLQQSSRVGVSTGEPDSAASLRHVGPSAPVAPNLSTRPEEYARSRRSRDRLARS